MVLTGAQSTPLTSVQQAVGVIEAANRNRVTSATAMNDASFIAVALVTRLRLAASITPTACCTDVSGVDCAPVRTTPSLGSSRRST